MALAIDASSPALASGTTATITTASFTTPASVFLLARVARNVATSGANGAGTVSGAGLTWTKLGAKTDYASETGVVTGGTNQPACVEVWWAYSSSALSSVTVSDARSDGLTGSNHEHALKVSVITGAETTPAGAKTANAAASGLPTTTTTTTAANAWLFSVSSDWLAKGAGTAGTGQTLENDYTVAGNITAHFWRQTAATATSGSSVTDNLTAPSAQQYNVLTVEVRPAAGGTNATVTGPASTATAAAPAGTVSTVRNVTLAGTVANPTATAPAGSVSGSAIVAGPVAHATAAALAGTVVTGGSIALAGPVATVTAQAFAGSVFLPGSVVPTHLPTTVRLIPESMGTAELVGADATPLLADPMDHARSDLWSFIGSAVTFDGRAHLEARADYSQILSGAVAFDLRGVLASVELVTAADNAATSGVETFWGMQDSTSGNTEQVSFLVEGDGNIYANFRAGSTSSTTAGSAPYDPVAHRHQRFRMAGGVLHWETSADNETWASLATWTPTWTPSSVTLLLGAGVWTGATPTVPAAFDNAQVAVPTPMAADGTSTAPLADGSGVVLLSSDGLSAAVIATT